MNEYNHTGHPSISTNEYRVAGRNLVITKYPSYVKQEPYVNDEGIWIPCEEYVQEGHASTYRCVLTKEMFIEAYNKWILDK